MMDWLPLVAVLGVLFLYQWRRHQPKETNVEKLLSSDIWRTELQNTPYDTDTQRRDNEAYVFNEPDGELVDVVGESHDNTDGTSRRRIISKLSVGDPVTLIAEPENPYSKTGVCVAVHTRYGQIGYIPEDDECIDQIFHLLEEKRDVPAKILNIFGGTGDKYNYGVKLDVQVDWDA